MHIEEIQGLGYIIFKHFYFVWDISCDLFWIYVWPVIGYWYFGGEWEPGVRNEKHGVEKHGAYD